MELNQVATESAAKLYMRAQSLGASDPNHYLLPADLSRHTKSTDPLNGGRGFDPTRAREGSGLQNMTDRIEALGGKLLIRSAPGQGTSIIGEVPVWALADHHRDAGTATNLVVLRELGDQVPARGDADDGLGGSETSGHR